MIFDKLNETMYPILKLSFVLLVFLQISEITGNHRVVRVINGENAVSKNFTFMVAVYIDGTFHCGGVNLNGGAVLTAAHCLYNQDPTKVSVKIGSSILTDKSMESYAIDSIIIHENYSEPTRDNDLAIIKLSTLMFGPSISSLPASNVSYSNTAKTCTVIGWGLITPFVTTDFLRDGDLTIMSDTDCMDELTKFNATEYYQSGQKYCAIGKNDDKYYTDACEGDGGGPFVCDNAVVGIVSWAHCLGITDYPPAIFVDVAKYTDWIEAHGGAAATAPTALFLAALMILYTIFNN